MLEVWRHKGSSLEALLDALSSSATGCSRYVTSTLVALGGLIFLMTAVYTSPPVWSLARAVRLLRLIKAGTSRPVRNNKPSEVLTSSCSASKDGKILAAPPLCVCSPFIHSSLMLLFCLSFFSPAGFLYSYFCHDLNMLFSMRNQISCIYTNVKGTLLLSCIT